MTKCLCVVCYFNMLVYIAVFESDGYCGMLKNVLFIYKTCDAKEAF